MMLLEWRKGQACRKGALQQLSDCGISIERRGGNIEDGMQRQQRCLTVAQNTRGDCSSVTEASS